MKKEFERYFPIVEENFETAKPTLTMPEIEEILEKETEIHIVEQKIHFAAFAKLRRETRLKLALDYADRQT